MLDQCQALHFVQGLDWNARPCTLCRCVTLQKFAAITHACLPRPRSLDDHLTAVVALQEARKLGRPIEHYADLGCGCGSVLLMVAWALPGATAVGVEAQVRGLQGRLGSVRLACESEHHLNALGHCFVPCYTCTDTHFFTFQTLLVHPAGWVVLLCTPQPTTCNVICPG
jgi:hypothetical protein